MRHPKIPKIGPSHDKNFNTGKFHTAAPQDIKMAKTIVPPATARFFICLSDKKRLKTLIAIP